MLKKFLACLLSLVLPLVAVSKERHVLTGKVVHVLDGDTLILLQNKTQYRIRLTEIDAPEKNQPFGAQARKHLMALCHNGRAQVFVHGKDKYGRTLGRVYCNGVDANAEQVRAGLAWVYDRYVSDLTLYQLQSDARRARRGLWAGKDPIPPWQWRN